MVSRIGSFRFGVLWLGLCAACADHPLATDPVPLDLADAGTVLYASLATYPVAGSDAQSIAMSVNGGGAVAGRDQFIGYHAWRISWKVEPRALSGECGIVQATVFLDSRITLPEWVPTPDADSVLQAQWSEFFLALKEHEAGHQLLVMGGAERVRRALLEVRAPRCEQIVARADSAGQVVLASIREEDARYDAETRHGATQGAIWPPVQPTPAITAH